MEWVILWVLFAVFSAVIAGSKNRSAANWFFIGLFFGPFGLLVAALPKLEAKSHPRSTADIKTCPRCKESIKSDAFVCRFCGLEFPFIDAAVRDHLLRIKALLREGLNNDEVAARLNSQGIKCLASDGIWNAELVANIRSEFVLDHS